MTGHRRPLLFPPHAALCCVHQVFAEFVASRRTARLCWSCCDEAFTEAAQVHKHVAHTHAEEVERHTHLALERLQRHLLDSKEEAAQQEEAGLGERLEDSSVWIPDVTHTPTQQLME